MGDRFLEIAAHTLLKLIGEYTLSNEIKNMIWKTFMFACSTAPELLIGRHMDHLIVSSFYVVCKINGCEKVSFNGIINEYLVPLTFRYGKCKKDNDEDWKEIVTNIKLKNGGLGNVIQFYNEVFMEKVKEYVFFLKRGQECLQIIKKLPAFWSEDLLDKHVNKNKLINSDDWLNRINVKHIYVFGKSSNKKLEKITDIMDH